MLAGAMDSELLGDWTSFLVTRCRYQPSEFMQAWKSCCCAAISNTKSPVDPDVAYDGAPDTDLQTGSQMTTFGGGAGCDTCMHRYRTRAKSSFVPPGLTQTFWHEHDDAVPAKSKTAAFVPFHANISEPSVSTFSKRPGRVALFFIIVGPRCPGSSKHEPARPRLLDATIP